LPIIRAAVVGLYRSEIASLAGLNKSTVTRHAAHGRYGSGVAESGRVEFDEFAVRCAHPRISQTAIDAVKAKRRSKPARRFTYDDLRAAISQRDSEWRAVRAASMEGL